VLGLRANEAGFVGTKSGSVPVRYDEIVIEVGFRIDLLVSEIIVVELKSVDAIAPIHKAQLLSYLKLSNRKIGLLINFNVELLKNGITRMAN
jgi:GxxExxY protein